MNPECKRSKTCSGNCGMYPGRGNKSYNYTYSAYRKDCGGEGITVAMPKPSACTGKRRPDAREGLYGRGLLHYSEWWGMTEVDIFVNGCSFTGIPIFADKNTLRVVNGEYSYFIPLEKIDCIRSAAGLKP